MGDRRVCNGEYKCELSGANKRLVPDHIDRRVEPGSSSATSGVINFTFPNQAYKHFLGLHTFFHTITEL